MTGLDTDLRSLAFFLADHAAVESGKVYVNGGFFNRLQFPTFPATVSIGVVAVLHVPWRAYHQAHTFSIALVDSDERPMGPQFGGQFQVGAAADMKVGDPTIMPLAAMLNGLPFDQPVDCAFVLEVDGVEIDRCPLRVVQVAGGPRVEAPGSGDVSAG